MHTTDDLLHEIEKLRAEVRELRATVHSSAAAPAEPPRPTNRRQLLTLAAAGMGGAGLAALAPAAPAAAANGEALVIGNSGSQSCTAATGVAVTGFAAPYGLAFTDNGLGAIPLPSAILGHARGFGGSTNFSTGVFGFAEQDSFYGVMGDSVRCGVRGIARGPADNGWPGVLGQSGTGVGVRGEGGTYGVVGYGNDAGVRGETDTRSAPALHAAAKSGLLALDGAQPAPPASGTFRRGDLLNDKNGSGVWACVSAGSPGSWRKVAGIATAGAFHGIDGGRAYDSRVSGAGGRLTATTTRNITIPPSLAPSGSHAVTYLLTVHDTGGSGGLTIYPAGSTRPVIQSAIWYGASQQHVVGGVTQLGPGREVRVYCTSGSTHITLDITGYYH